MKKKITIELTPSVAKALQWEIDWSHSFGSWLNKQTGLKPNKKPTVKDKAKEILESHCKYWPE